MADGSNARFRRLDDALKDSFSNIRDDIGNIDQRLSFHVNSIKEIKKELEDSKKDFVSIDKLNVMKIKLGDLKEELKTLYRIEKELKETRDKSADREKTDKEIDEVKRQIDSLEKATKSVVNESRFQKLVDEINNEFKDVRKSLQVIEEKGGESIKGKLSKIENESLKRYNLLDSKIEIDVKNRYGVLNRRIEHIHNALQNMTSKQQVNQLVRDINKEFDGVKEVLHDISVLKKDLKTVRREKLGRPYFEQQVEIMNRQLQELRSEIEKMKKKSRLQKEGKNEMGSSNKGWLKRTFTAYFFANTFIVLAFVSLAASLVMYLAGLPGLMDYLIYVAVGLFILGIILRVLVVIRG